jgi:hypothetical protein
MKTILTLFVTGILSASVLSASPATAAPAQIITDLAGTVHIQQAVPCGELVDVTTSIAEGRMEITPQMTRDGVFFDLTRMDMFLSPFSVERSCKGMRAVASFTEIGVRLAGAVRFQGQAVPTDGPRLFRFVIPQESFLIFESVVDNLKVGQPETAYQRPSEDVVGFIELMPTERGIVIKRVQLHIALRTQLHFQAGCLPGGRCRIDEIDEGTQTSDVVAGALDPDTTPPTVACTRVDSAGRSSPAPVGDDDRTPGNRFRASASDTGGTPVIRLGAYVLGNGEVVKLVQTGKPGVRLVNTKRPRSIRHFLVGRGENFIMATDPAGNVATAYCR